VSAKKIGPKLIVVAIMFVLGLIFWWSASAAELKGFVDDGARSWWVFDKDGEIIYCTGDSTPDGRAICKQVVNNEWIEIGCVGLQAEAGYIGDCTPLKQ
jgi:hypothetical protein